MQKLDSKLMRERMEDLRRKQKEIDHTVNQSMKTTRERLLETDHLQKARALIRKHQSRQELKSTMESRQVAEQSMDDEQLNDPNAPYNQLSQLSQLQEELGESTASRMSRMLRDRRETARSTRASTPLNRTQAVRDAHEAKLRAEMAAKSIELSKEQEAAMHVLKQQLEETNASIKFLQKTARDTFDAVKDTVGAVQDEGAMPTPTPTPTTVQKEAVLLSGGKVDTIKTCKLPRAVAAQRAQEIKEKIQLHAGNFVKSFHGLQQLTSTLQGIPKLVESQKQQQDTQNSQLRKDLHCDAKTFEFLQRKMETINRKQPPFQSVTNFPAPKQDNEPKIQLCCVDASGDHVLCNVSGMLKEPSYMQIYNNSGGGEKIRFAENRASTGRFLVEQIGIIGTLDDTGEVAIWKKSGETKILPIMGIVVRMCGGDRVLVRAKDMQHSFIHLRDEFKIEPIKTPDSTYLLHDFSTPTGTLICGSKITFLSQSLVGLQSTGIIMMKNELAYEEQTIPPHISTIVQLLHHEHSNTWYGLGITSAPSHSLVLLTASSSSPGTYETRATLADKVSQQDAQDVCACIREDELWMAFRVREGAYEKPKILSFNLLTNTISQEHIVHIPGFFIRNMSPSGLCVGDQWAAGWVGKL